MRYTGWPFLVAALAATAGCASYKSTLTNAHGQTITCEASGKNGIVTGHYVRQAYEDCLASARAQGYK